MKQKLYLLPAAVIAAMLLIMPVIGRTGDSGMLADSIASGSIAIQDDAGKQRILLHIDSAGRPEILLTSRSGLRSVSITVTDSGEVLMEGHEIEAPQAPNP